jgi:hypothetical protein
MTTDIAAALEQPSAAQLQQLYGHDDECEPPEDLASASELFNWECGPACPARLAHELEGYGEYCYQHCAD